MNEDESHGRNYSDFQSGASFLRHEVFTTMGPGAEKSLITDRDSARPSSMSSNLLTFGIPTIPEKNGFFSESPRKSKGSDSSRNHKKLLEFEKMMREKL